MYIAGKINRLQATYLSREADGGSRLSIESSMGPLNCVLGAALFDVNGGLVVVDSTAVKDCAKGVDIPAMDAGETCGAKRERARKSDDASSYQQAISLPRP